VLVECATQCGEARWAVKTLSDKRERLVNFKPKDTTVNRLRKKLEADPKNPHYVLTVRGVGYKLNENP
jgi:DNA-binding response OmpR family regulator